jgi:hypothetical protein
MKKLRVWFPTVTDRVLETIGKRGEMSVEEAAELLGCSPAGVADFLNKLVISAKDPRRYIVKWLENTVQVVVERRSSTVLRRRMMRLPEFQQVERLPQSPTWFTLGQAVRALKTPRRKTARLLDRYCQMGYLISFEDASRRGGRAGNGYGDAGLALHNQVSISTT